MHIFEIDTAKAARLENKFPFKKFVQNSAFVGVNGTAGSGLPTFVRTQAPS